MKTVIRKTIVISGVLSLIISMLLSLSACSKESIVKDGIDVEPAPQDPITIDTRERTEEVISSLVSLYFEEKSERISKEEEKEITDKTVNLIIQGSGTDKKCRKFAELMENNGRTLVSTFVSVIKGKAQKDALNILGNIYFEVTAKTDSELLGTVAYGLALISFDRRIEKHLAANDAVGNVLAKDLQAKKAVLEADIGEGGFCSVLRLGFFSRAFFVGGTLDLSLAEQFSNKELLIFVKNLDFSTLDIKPNGYKLIIDYYSDVLIIKETNYFDELIYKANSNGDIDEISVALAKLPSLISKIQSRLSADDIGYLRDGNAKELLHSVFSKFTDEDFAAFENLMNTPITPESYDALAERLYTDSFISYKSSMSASELSELKDAAIGDDSDTFYEIFEEYIYGICPAFSFMIYMSDNGMAYQISEELS